VIVIVSYALKSERDSISEKRIMIFTGSIPGKVLRKFYSID